MREYTLKRWLLAACTLALAAPTLSGAAGLGRLTVNSALGQPLNAEVELLSVQKGETLSARLSSVDTYQRANLPYNSGLVGTRVTIERRPNGAAYLKVTTPRAISEPFAELLIEINSEHGRVTRQYTVLLDPPGYGRGAGELPPPPPPVAAPNVRPPAVTTEAAPPAAAAPGAPLEGAPGPAATPAPAPAPRAGRPAGRAAPAAPPERSAAGATQYGPVKRGETLGGIAKSVQPQGVSLEQTLIGLYRHNPDAFIKKNMNLVKSGRILTVPEATELAAVGQRDAVKEIRLQVADFNSFRGRVADRAGAAPEDGSVNSGRIGARVAKGEAAEARDTVRLSRGDAKGAAKGNAAERARALEEEGVAREKALADANTRIAQLERTIQDMKRLADMKSGAAPADKSASAAPPPAAKGQAPGPVATAPIVPPPPVMAPEQAAKGKAPDAAAKGPDAAARGADPMKGQDLAARGRDPMKSQDSAARGPDSLKGQDLAAGTPGAMKAPAESAKAEGDLAPPKAKPKAPPAPAVATEPDLIDTLTEEPLYLVAGAGVLVLGGLAFVAARRRREGAKSVTRAAPSLGPRPGADSSGGTRAVAAAPGAEARGTAAPSPSPEDNDLDFNAATRLAGTARGDSPQRVEPAARAEPPRRAAPRRAEPPKVAEPPAVADLQNIGDLSKVADVPKVADLPNIGDLSKVADVPKVADFPKVADLPKFGDLPKIADRPKVADRPKIVDIPKAAEPPKVAEPSRPEYQAPEPVARVDSPKRAEPTMRAEPPKREPAPHEDLMRLPEAAPRAAAPTPPKASTTGLSAARALEPGAGARAADLQPPGRTEKVDSSPPLDLPDFSLEVPPAGADRGLDSRPVPATSDFNMDFNLEPLPPIDVPGDSKPGEPAAPARTQSQSQSNDLEFKLDDISLDFGAKTPAAGGGAAGAATTPKDDHWYDVQQKFDLAKAYEEMGDKDGARDILKEVVKEGDADQQAQAKKLLNTLS